MTPEFTLPPWMREFLDAVLSHGIRPQAALLAPIAVSGRVAVVAFEPAPVSHRALVSLGWDEKTPVFALDDALRVRLAEAWKAADDPVGHAWLAPREREDGGSRILVFARDKPLLFNYRAGGGYSIEPKSLLMTRPAPATT